jgi:uncharacterized membrane protein YuzA (DUF378 family)
MKIVNFVAMLLAYIGAINWGFVAFFHINLVQFVCRYIPVSHLNMAIYALVAISGLYCLVSLFVNCKK